MLKNSGPLSGSGKNNNKETQMTQNRNKKSGFSLIELLIVIVVIAIISLVAVQRFRDVERSARTTVADVNARTLERTTQDFFSLNGVFPSEWHTGLAPDLNPAANSSVEGLGLQTALNMAAAADGSIAGEAIVEGYTQGYRVATTGANVQELSAEAARALRDNGIHQLRSGGYRPVTEPDSTPGAGSVDDSLVAWVLTDGAELYRGGTAVQQTVPPWGIDYTRGTEVVTINGRTLGSWASWGASVVLVFCTQEVNWGAVLKGDPDAAGWGEFVKNSTIMLAEPPVDPNARVDSVFPYYIAAFYLSPDQVGGAGISAELLGVLDQDMRPVRN